MNRLFISVLRRAVIGVILVSAVSLPAFASDRLFVEISGISGSSNAKGFEGDIEVTGISMGYSTSGAPGELVFNPLVVTKAADKSTTAIMEAGAKGVKLQNVTLHMVPPATGNQVSMRVTIPSALVTDWRLTDSKVGVPVEQFTLMVTGYSVVYEETSGITGAKSQTVGKVP